MQYEVIGEDLPAVICTLGAGETMITENGSMSWMSPNMKMETNGNGLKKMLGRMITGESVFLNKYTAIGHTGEIAFASSFPGSIIPYEIEPGNELIVQKRGFLASTDGVELSVYLQKKLGAGFFGGEGFIMQRLSGKGIAFIEIDGAAVEYNLAAGESIVVGTGYLAAMTATCTMNIVTVPGLKNKLLGGEGFFNTTVKGPGKVILQTMPICAVAGAIAPFISAQTYHP